MNILYVDWQMYGKEDIIKALTKLGHHVEVTDLQPANTRKDPVFTNQLSHIVTEKKTEALFTSNYHPILSNFCNEQNIKYISWTYDSPLINLYDESINNPCNYTFIFDSDECLNLRQKGAKHIFYLPLAFDPERIDAIPITPKDESIFSTEVGMVASLYNEKHNLYDRMAPKLTEYTRGYLEGIMQVQKNLFGGFILEEALYNQRVMHDILSAMPYPLDKGSLANLEYVYANYFLSRKVATMQRTEYIREISKRYRMKVYTTGDLSDIPTVTNMGPVNYLIDMNKAFKLSKINLNITLPSIHTGVPLRIMDILGAGGFLLTNYQQDLFELFEPDKDFVYFTSLEEALYKIDYYLHHEDERAEIAANGKTRMLEAHTYDYRLHEMFALIAENE